MEREVVKEFFNKPIEVHASMFGFVKGVTAKGMSEYRELPNNCQSEIENEFHYYFFFFYVGRGVLALGLLTLSELGVNVSNVLGVI